MIMLKGIVIRNSAENKTEIRFGHGTIATVNSNENFKAGEDILISYDYTNMSVKSIISKKKFDEREEKERKRLNSLEPDTEGEECPEEFINSSNFIDFPENSEGFLKPISLEDIETEIQWDSEGPVDTEGFLPPES